MVEACSKLQLLWNASLHPSVLLLIQYLVMSETVSGRTFAFIQRKLKRKSKLHADSYREIIPDQFIYLHLNLFEFRHSWMRRSVRDWPIIVVLKV